MGLPIDKLIVGTNENDILHRFFSRGEYHSTEVKETLSPSMDIQISSNFERYLYDLTGNSSKQLQLWMDEFEQSGELTVESNLQKKAQQDFASARVDDKEILSIIRKFHQLGPHTGTNSLLFLCLVPSYQRYTRTGEFCCPNRKFWQRTGRILRKNHGLAD